MRAATTGRWGAVLGAAVCVVSACTAPAPTLPDDAGIVRVIVSGDQTAGADSALACVLRTVPPAGADGTGTVARCTNPVDVPPVLELSLPPGAHRLRALRSACPGMPGDCSNDPYAEQYALDSAEWSCEVDVAVSPRSTTEVRVEVSAGPPRAECTTA